MSSNEDENLGSFYMGRMRPPPEPKRVLPRGLLSAVVVLSFAAIIWYAYPQGQEKYAGLDIPVVKAETEAYKSAPEDPGGMEIRHQDSTIFDPLEQKGDSRAEQLMPAPEAPMDKTEALGAAEESSPVLDSKEPRLNLQMQGKTPVVEQIVPKSEQKPAAVKAEEVKKGTAPPAAAKPAVAEAKPAVAGSVYIQLGSYRSNDGAAKDWVLLQKKHPAQLTGLSMKTERVDLGRKGIFYRLQAGKLTEDKAREVCGVLKSANSGGCILVR